MIYLLVACLRGILKRFSKKLGIDFFPICLQRLIREGDTTMTRGYTECRVHLSSSGKNSVGTNSSACRRKVSAPSALIIILLYLSAASSETSPTPFVRHLLSFFHNVIVFSEQNVTLVHVYNNNSIRHTYPIKDFPLFIMELFPDVHVFLEV